MSKHTSRSVMFTPAAGNGRIDPPPDDLRKVIQARIAALEKERTAYVDEANRTIASYNAAIGELQRLLQPPSIPPVESNPNIEPDAEAGRESTP